MVTNCVLVGFVSVFINAGVKVSVLVWVSVAVLRHQNQNNL